MFHSPTDAASQFFLETNSSVIARQPAMHRALGWWGWGEGRGGEGRLQKTGHHLGETVGRWVLFNDNSFDRILALEYVHQGKWYIRSLPPAKTNSTHFSLFCFPCTGLCQCIELLRLWKEIYLLDNSRKQRERWIVGSYRVQCRGNVITLIVFATESSHDNKLKFSKK